MKIQPQLFITPHSVLKNNNQNKNNSNTATHSTPQYKPAYYQDYNINFGARLFRTPANFYAQPFNKSGMPQTMKDYLNDDYEDRQNIPPAQMMKIVFEPIQIADNLEDVKELFPDEPLFENLSSTPKRKVRTGVIAEIDLMKDENGKLFKDINDSLGLYLLKKIYLEGKSLKEINNDFQKDISPEYRGLSPIDYSTLGAYGIKMPNLAFWKSFLATREDFPYEYKPRKAYERTVSQSKQEQKELSLEDIKNLPPKTNAQPSTKQKGKFDNIKDWEIDKLADAMLSGKGDENETRRILKKKNIKNSESTNFVMKYMWAIMPIVLEKTNASAEMKSFWADYDATNKSQKEIMGDYWKQTPQMQALQSLMMKDTIKMFMEAYGVDGNNEEFQQLLQYPAQIAERRKQFDKEHELKQKYYDEMFAELDIQEQPQVNETPSTEPTDSPVEDNPVEKNEDISHIKITPATGEIQISDDLRKQFEQKILDELDILPNNYKNKYMAFMKKHPLVDDEFKLTCLCGNTGLIRTIAPEILTSENAKDIFNLIDKEFTEAEPVMFNNLRQAFIDTLSEMNVENVQNLYWEDSFSGLREGLTLIPDNLKGRFKKIIENKYASYKSPITNSEALKITNVVMQLLLKTNPDEISSKNQYMNEAYQVVHLALVENQQIRKDLKEYIQKNDVITKQGGNMRALLRPEVPEETKKEKVINLIATNKNLAAYITALIIDLATSDYALYLKLKQLKDSISQ